ncbi:MAG: hypothetical protein CMJ23_00285 [Phycisphaerae bacterium]|nr:hypothetical protein [Phycisphaerae bacterium]
MSRSFSSHARNGTAFAFAMVLVGLLSGCEIFGVASVIGQNIEREKKVEVLAEYDGLRDSTVAVVVLTDMMVMYEHPGVVANICVNLSDRIARNVQGVQVLDPRFVLDWQHQTAGWQSMAYGLICEELGVERVIWLDLFEFRLHPPGNRWQWDGAASANIGIVEIDGFDPDSFGEAFDVSSTFPNVPELGRESATASQIQTGLLATFVQKAGWLFYDHIEDKYPDA